MVVLKQKCHDTSFLPSLRCTAWAIIRKKVQFRIVKLFETTIHLLKYFSNFNLLPTIFLGDEKKPQPYRHILRQNLMMRTCCVLPMSLTRLVGLNELKGLIGFVDDREKALSLASLQCAACPRMGCRAQLAFHHGWSKLIKLACLCLAKQCYSL